MRSSITVGRYFNLSLASGSATPAAVGSIPAVTANGGGASVYYQGIDQHIHQIWYDGCGNHADLSKMAGTNALAYHSPTAVGSEIGSQVF